MEGRLGIDLHLGIGPSVHLKCRTVDVMTRISSRYRLHGQDSQEDDLPGYLDDSMEGVGAGPERDVVEGGDGAQGVLHVHLEDGAED